MSAEEITENFSLDEACLIATCDHCKKQFNIKYFGDIRAHFLEGCEK